MIPEYTSISFRTGVKPLPPKTQADVDVHVWRVMLDHPLMSKLDLFSILSPDEHARADRFKFNLDRKRFIARRGLLRVILADYLDVEPAQVRFCYGLHGKPALDMAWLGRRLQFNLSHSKDIALFAVSQDCQLGIDVEFVRPILDAASLAERFFSARESTFLHSLPEEERAEAFLRLWTCKEAYLKASGKGLTMPLANIDVLFLAREVAERVSANGDQYELDRWSLKLFQPAPGYLAALAVDAPSPCLELRQLLLNTIISN
jgi:4'-phosphopantetheinyl transferase